mgnify:FL=1
MKFGSSVAVLCALMLSAAPASSQPIKIGDDGLRVRLLRGVLGLEGTAADATLVAAVAISGGNTKANIRALLSSTGKAATVAAWLDDGEWPTGTPQSEKAALVASLLDADGMVSALQAAQTALFPPLPTGPKGLRALTGETGGPSRADEHARSVAVTAFWAVAPAALRVKIETGAWPPMLSTEQRAALVTALRGLDLRALTP